MLKTETNATNAARTNRARDLTCKSKRKRKGTWACQQHAEEERQEKSRTCGQKYERTHTQLWAPVYPRLCSLSEKKI